MKSTMTDDRELGVAMMSSAGLELFWAAIAVGCALLAMTSIELVTIIAVAAVASSIAMLAHSGELAARWPRTAEPPGGEAVGFKLVVAIVALASSSLAIAGVAPLVLAALALLLLSGLLVLDGPLEPALAAPRGRAAGSYMALAGLAAIIVLASALLARTGVQRALPWAALLIGSAQLTGAAAVLARFTRPRAV